MFAAILRASSLLSNLCLIFFRHFAPSATHLSQNFLMVFCLGLLSQTVTMPPIRTAFTLYADYPLRHCFFSNRVHGLGGGNGSLYSPIAIPMSTMTNTTGGPCFYLI
jgi:hypothetical protein